MGVKQTVSNAQTEAKIKSAAKKLFTKKGFKGTTVRAVAEDAGVNVALVNYYFQSKEKLFDVIVAENFKDYIEVVQGLLGSESMSLEERVSNYVGQVIDQMKRSPQLPMFILREMQQNPNLLRQNEGFAENRSSMSLLVDQLLDMNPSRKKEIDKLQLQISISSLIIFPMLSRTMTMTMHGLDAKGFDAFMDKRKQVITDMIVRYIQ